MNLKKQLIRFSLAALIAGVPIMGGAATGNGRSAPRTAARSEQSGSAVIPAAYAQRGHDEHGRVQNRGEMNRGRERGERHEEHGRHEHGDRYRYSAPYYFGFSYNSPYYHNYGNPYYSPYAYSPYGYGYSYSASYQAGYNDGFNAGRSDLERGFSYNPRRYPVNGDIDYLNGFDAGYAAGYNGGY